jgi:hypothetical protein
MLINKGISAGSVISLKLTSGEEIIARFVEKTVTGHRVLKPMVLTMGPKGIGLIPYLITANMENELEIFNSAITVVTETDKEFSDQYMQNTTGIRMA